MSALPITTSNVAGTVAMNPAEINAKLASLQGFTADEKAANNKEVALGLTVGDAKEFGAAALDGGITTPGLAFLAAPMGVVSSLFTRDFFSKRELAELTDKHRDLIANKLSMNADDVSEAHLKALAQRDPELAQSLVAIAKKRDAHVVNNSVGVGGMMAGAAGGAALGTALIPIPGVGTAIGFLGGMAGGMFGYEMGEGIGKYFTDTTDAVNPAKVVEALKEKKEAGQYITTQDVFALKLAQNEKLRETVVFRYGDNFHMLDAAAQNEVMSSVPQLYQQAARDAMKCNLPEADVRELLFGEIAASAANANFPPQTNWTSRITAERSNAATAAPQPISWTDAIMQRRAAITEQAAEPEI